MPWKIPHGTKIDLTEDLAPTPPVRQKITMADDNSPSNKSVEGSPSPLDETLLENLADVAGRAPTLDMNVEAGEAEEEDTPTKKETEKKKEHSSSKKKKEPSTPSSAQKGGGDSSHTESSSAQLGVDDKTMKVLSLSGSSGGVDEEQEADSGEGVGGGKTDGDDDYVEEVAEPPAKKARVQTRAKGKAPMSSVKKEKVKVDLANREMVVPKKLDFKLLGRLGIEEGVKENFKNVGGEYFMDWETTTYAELVKEFYEELHVEMNKAGPESISFRLRGVERIVKISDLNTALEMVDWVDLSTKEYINSE